MDQNDPIPLSAAGRPDLTLDLSEPGEPAFPAVPDIALEREIGRGGNGVVYLGRQTYLERTVAVKVINPGKIGTEGGRFTERFQREAKLLAGLAHPNIVACYQAGLTPDGDCYLAMEFVEGHSLSEHIAANGPLHPEIAARIALDTARALDFANARGIIHRDVKPDNILLRTESGPGADSGFPFTVKLVDLGLAKVCDDGDTARMTQTGLVMGTPVTMAPEQFTDPEGVDFRADIYGLGCVLYQCLTAVRAFPQRDIMAVMMAKSAGGVPDPSSLRPELPPGLTSLVKGLLAPKPADRPQTYSEVMALLAMFARGAAVAATPHPTPGIEAAGAGALKSTRIIAPQRAPESRPGSRRPVMAVAALAIASLVAVAWFAATRPEAAAPVAPVAADVAAAPAAGRGLAAPIAGAVRAAVKARRLAQRAGQQAPDGLAEPAPAAPDFTTMRFDVNLHAAFDAEPNRRMDAWTASGTARWTPDSEGEGEGTAVFATEGKGVLARPLTLTTFIAQVRLRDIDREAGIALLDEDGRMLSLSVQNFGSGNFKAAGREGAVVADGTPELKGAINVVPVTSVSDSPVLTLKASGGWVRGEVNGTEIFTHQIGFLPHRTALFAIGSQGAKATVFVNFNVRAATGR